MKKGMMVLFLCAISYAAVMAQKITTDKVPALVYRSFKTKFPASNQESWAKESDTVYVVDFYNDRKRQTGSFGAGGTWLQTETEINFNQLPRVVNASFNKQFGGFTIQETTEVETPDHGTQYSMIINKGSEGYEVQFSAKGELVKKDAAKSEE
jgi:hypothetical protein